MRVRLDILHRDWWVGAAWNRRDRHILVQLLPCLRIRIELASRRCSVCGKPPIDGAATAYVPWKHYSCHVKTYRARR
jgi:hypothetical protein